MIFNDFKTKMLSLFFFCVYMYTHVHTCTHIYTYLHTSTHIYTHVHTCTHMYIHLHTCTYIYTHIHTCTHKSTDKHIHCIELLKSLIKTIKISVIERFSVNHRFVVSFWTLPGPGGVSQTRFDAYFFSLSSLWCGICGGVRCACGI